MNSVTETLKALQDLELNPRTRPAGGVPRAERIATLRQSVPENYLSLLDRSVRRKRKAVAVVRNGVCGECHLRLPVATVSALSFGEEMQVCGNCGRILYLSLSEPFVTGVTPEKKTAKSAPKEIVTAA